MNTIKKKSNRKGTTSFEFTCNNITIDEDMRITMQTKYENIIIVSLPRAITQIQIKWLLEEMIILQVGISRALVLCVCVRARTILYADIYCYYLKLIPL